MKRARHRWIGINFIYAASLLLLLNIPETFSVRATSLIFAKSTSTTGAPAEAGDGEQPEVTAEGEQIEVQNATKSKLSGIPQIDYIYDPNLPRELNGYNLSEYPFFETVPKPETIDFKCDGLHDGFYASIPHKCQVYHHCLFGTRYDFLCANYTAFDQKTFICQFVSEVDCKNSANYFSRNEALYKAATTTTLPPPTTTTTTTTTPPPPRERAERPERPGRRRPVYRYDYYDDDYYYPARDDYEYEERGNRRRPRPRPQARPGRKRRPYADYEDDRYERRQRPQDEMQEDYEDRRPYERPRPGAKRVHEQRRQHEVEEERRPNRDQPRRPFRRDQEEEEVRRPTGRGKEEVRPRDEIRPRDEKRPREEIRPRDEKRQEFKPRENSRPKERERPREEERRYSEDRPYNRNKEERGERPKEEEEEVRAPPSAPEGTTLVKPNGRGIFSQPRMPPKIKRPVPAVEKSKYDYVPVTVTTTKAPPKAAYDDEYYDYEDDTSKPSSSGKSASIQQRPRPEPVEKEKFKPSRPHYPQTTSYKTKKRPVEYEEYYYDPTPIKSQKLMQKTKKPVEDYEYDYEEDMKEVRRPIASVKSQDRDVTHRFKEVKPNVKVIKRPFLPSRGGSPYLPRGLKPVGGRDLTAPLPTTPKPTSTSTTTTTTTTTTEKTTTLHSTTDNSKPAEEEYEYYDEEDIEYDAKEEPAPTTTQTAASTKDLSTKTAVLIEKYNEPETVSSVTEKVETTTFSHEQSAQKLAAKVLKIYNDNYEAIKTKLDTTAPPADYIKEYLEAETGTKSPVTPQTVVEQPKMENFFDMPTPSPNPEISKPYTATGKPVIPDDIPIKQNLADSIENDYDVTINEAITPSILSRKPTGFVQNDFAYSRFRNNFHGLEPTYAATDLSNYQIRKRPQINVSIRTPQSFFIQPSQRLSPGYHPDDGIYRPGRHIIYRQPVAYI